jgi:hypothetical protein
LAGRDGGTVGSRIEELKASVLSIVGIDEGVRAVE